MPCAPNEQRGEACRLPIYGTSREILSGRWSGHVFYTLGWPEIRGVVEKPDLDSNDNPCPSYFRSLSLMSFYAPDPQDIDLILYHHIDWTQPLALEYLSEAASSAVLRLLKEKGIEYYKDYPMVTMQAKQGDITARPVPEGLTLKCVDPETDAAYCASTWYFQAPENVDYFKSVASRLPSACLINSANERVSFELGTEYGFLRALFTREEYRRQGLAQVVVSNLVQEYFERGLPAMAFVEQINEASLKMHRTLGFKELCNVHFIASLPGEVKDKENNSLYKILKGSSPFRY